MPKYELSDAVRDFNQHTIIINNLWTVYVAATFAAAGFGITASLNWTTAGLVVFAFWLFAVAHLSALIIPMSVQTKIAEDIRSVVDAVDLPFKNSLVMLVRPAVELKNFSFFPIVIHIIIDICATVALLIRIP